MTSVTPLHDQCERRAGRTQQPAKHGNGACRSGRQAGSQSGPLATLTKRQREVYDFCVRHVEANHCFPSFRRISEEFRWKSPNAAYDACERLWAHGMLSRRPGGFRFAKARVVVLHDGEDAA